MKRRLIASASKAAFTVAVVLVGFAGSLVLVAATGADPLAVASSFVTGAFGTPYAVSATISKTVPLVLVSLGWILVSSGGRYQIGFPGQVMAGGLCAAAVALHAPAAIALPLAMLAALGGGALLASVAAALWVRFGVNEILSTLLLNLIMAVVVSWAILGPLQESSGQLPQSDVIQDAARWPLFPGLPALRFDVVLIPIAVVLVAVLLRRTAFGLRLRVVGSSPLAARYAGISPGRLGVMSITASGALAGVAGGSLVLAGPVPYLVQGFEGGYGFEGIVVGLLAGGSPLACIPAALLFAALRQGGAVVEVQEGVSASVVLVAQGIVVLLVLVGTTGLDLARKRWGRRSATAAKAEVG